MILAEDFNANLCCSYKYDTCWWQKIGQEEECMAAIEDTVLNIPLENFELWRVQDTMDYIRKCVEDVLEERNINLYVKVTWGHSWFGVLFYETDWNQFITSAHLIIKKKEYVIS